ncbi:acyltransferase family protein [Terrimonas sp.]|uniref:acyltransferase family protein n=1 Tax=Terrimonas sp. TaxID=1914338 RepID=UPI0014022167|nr:acyltransferase family protein [Terrimonas sp.]
MAKDRLDFIDRMKGIAILLVIVGHILQFNKIDGGTNNKLFGIIYSFHMPLFFILSGYVATFGRDRITGLSSFFKSIWRKAYTLLLPLFAWSLIARKYFFASDFQIIGVSDIFNTILNPDLWFLKVLFEIHVLFAIFCLLNYYLSRKGNIYIDLLTFFVILLLPIAGYFWIDTIFFQSLLLYILFFFFGSFLSRYQFLENFLLNNYVYALSLFVFLVFSAHWKFAGNLFDDVLKVVLSIAAFTVLLGITQKSNLPEWADAQMQQMGRESLSIYVMQFYLTNRISFFSWSTGLNQYILFVLVLTLSVLIAYICIFVHKIFEKSAILNLLFYGKRL